MRSSVERSGFWYGYGEIENILKTAGFILFFLKKIVPLPCQIPESGRKSGHQVGENALKWLDNTVKPRPKIGWRNRHFLTIQQIKNLWHLFCHRLMSECYKRDTRFICHSTRKLKVRSLLKYSQIILIFTKAFDLMHQLTHQLRIFYADLVLH